MSAYKRAESCKTSGCTEPLRLNKNGVTMGYCAAHWRDLCGRSAAASERTHFDGADGHRAYVQKNGYVQLWTTEGVISEHKYVMEKKIGRPMRSGESAHHINGIRTDNRSENLELWVVPQPPGQRVADLVDFVASQYPSEVLAAIAGKQALGQEAGSERRGDEA